MTPNVAGIYIAAEAGARPLRLDRCQALKGQGLIADRYANGLGTFSQRPGDGRNLTLIDEEVVGQLKLQPGAARRNLETRGIDLRELIGQFFTIGNVLAFGARACDPCQHLARLLKRPHLVAELMDRGGLRADVLSSDLIETGAEIRVLGPKLRVYLDDERVTPERWFRVDWPEQAIEVLETGRVSVISLDHDLGDDARGTGYDVVQWIEEKVFTEDFAAPTIHVHSANVAGRRRMQLGIESIQRRQQRS